MDSCVFVGFDRITGIEHDLAQTRRRLESLGVKRALAASLSAIQHHHLPGNRETLAACKAHKDFFIPLGAITSATFVPGAGIMRDLADKGFPMVGVFPGWPDPNSCEMSTGVEAPVYQRIFEEAEQARLAILVGVNDRHDLSHLVRLAKSVRSPVIVRWLNGSGYMLVPDVISMSRSAPNLYFDISIALQSGAVRMLVDTVGADRFLIASAAPLFYEACPYFLVLGSGISSKDQDAILSGTLSRLLGVEDPGFGEIGARPSERCRPFETFRAMKKTDVLWHAKSTAIVNPCDSDDALDELAARWSIKAIMLSSFDAIFDRMAPGNAELAELVDRNTNYWGLVAIHPRELPASLAEIEKFAAHPKIVGIKILQDSAYNLALDRNDLLDPIFECVRRLAPDWAVLAHPPGLETAAERNPDLTFVCEHGIWRHELLARLDNVFFEISTSSTDRRQNDLAKFLHTARPDRMLFGTDAPMIDPSIMIGKLASSGFDPARHGAMLDGNAEKAFPRVKAKS